VPFVCRTEPPPGFLGLLPNGRSENALLYVGSIEIWSIDRRQSVKRDVNAIDSPLAWFPDGKRLAYVKLAEPREGAMRRDAIFARQFQNWKKIPSVYVWDVDAGTETFLHVGSAPMVSQDGRFVLISEYDGRAWVHVRVDVETGESTRVAYHESKNAGESVIASTAQDIVLTSNLTYKRKRGLFRLFEVPERIVTFGLARLDTEEFRTLLTVEYAREVSFGQVSETRER
jgi:Tol biopolymer transport system component